MPNIMLTYRCNLHCSYCFANEFVNKDKTDITIENFMKAVSFLAESGQPNLGLIGGEPTLHPGFKLIMDLLAHHPGIKRISVFTNGLLLDRFIPQLIHPKVKVILVNCNSPLVIGEKPYNIMRQNLDLLLSHEDVKNTLTLGINLYSNDMDYSYIIDLLQRYDMHRLRISLTVPDFSSCGEMEVLQYFAQRKDFLMEFFHRMDDIGVLPYYDCNKPPYCIWTDDEKRWLEAFVSKHPGKNDNIISYRSNCDPVVDILPNLQAVRCFGMSDFTKVSISDFHSYQDLVNYFVNEIDACAYKLSSSDDCKDCYRRKTKQCVQGCMGFKASRIHTCNAAVERI